MTYFARREPSLLQRFKEGDRVALEGVYREYVDSVARTVAATLRRYGGAGRLGGWRDIASDLPDLVQEVFTRAFEPEARRRFDGVRPYGPYLGRIAHNVVVDYFRRQQREITLDFHLLISNILPNGDGRAVPDDLADQQTMAVVGRYLSLLPADLQRVHDALFVQGLSQRDAAIALGLGRQVVRTLESRLREGLRRALKEGGQLDALDDVPLAWTQPYSKETAR